MTSTSPASPLRESDSDRRTHTAHTINLPYRDARNAATRPQNPHQRQVCPQSGGNHSQPHHSFTSINTPAEPAAQFPSSPSSSTSPSSALPTSSAAAAPEDVKLPTPSSKSTTTKQEQLALLVEGLEGKWIGEFGNILDWDGTVLGRVEGDLPSMIGPPVSESGEILDAGGDVVGHVFENYAQQQRQQEEEKFKIPQLHELDGGMRVDAAGNIYNPKGDVVGKLNEPPPQAQQEQSKTRPGENSQNPCSCMEPDRAAAAAPNPSEIYLDVKSTYDGIQLIIKIPTVFNRD